MRDFHDPAYLWSHHSSVELAEQEFAIKAVDRWTQVDPLNQFQDPRQGNRYVYGSCDAVNLSDPSGESAYGRAIGFVTGCAAGLRLGALVGTFVASPVVGGVLGCLGNGPAGALLGQAVEVPYTGR